MGIVSEFYQKRLQKLEFEFVKFNQDNPKTLKLFNAFKVKHLKNPRTGEMNEVLFALVFDKDEGKYKVFPTSSLDMIKVFYEVELSVEKPELKAFYVEGDIIKVARKRIASSFGFQTKYIVEKIGHEEISEVDKEKIKKFLGTRKTG